MGFKDKYKTKGDTDPKKKEISDDAYAIGDVLEELIKQLERTRQTSR